MPLDTLSSGRSLVRHLTIVHVCKTATCHRPKLPRRPPARAPVPLIPAPISCRILLPSPCTTARSRRTVGVGIPDGGEVASLPLLRMDWVRPSLRAKGGRGTGCTCFPTCDGANRVWTPQACLAELRRKSARPPASSEPPVTWGKACFILTTSRTTGTEAILAPCRTSSCAACHRIRRSPDRAALGLA